MTELFKTVTKKPIVTPDGVEHATLEDAQKHLLAAFFSKSTIVQAFDAGVSQDLAGYVITNKTDLLAIIGKQPRKARTPKASAATPATAAGKGGKSKP